MALSDKILQFAVTLSGPQVWPEGYSVQPLHFPSLHSTQQNTLVFSRGRVGWDDVPPPGRCVSAGDANIEIPSRAAAAKMPVVGSIINSSPYVDNLVDHFLMRRKSAKPITTINKKGGRLTPAPPSSHSSRRGRRVNRTFLH